MFIKNKPQFFQKNITVLLGALICCALWGSAFPCIKIGYRLFAVDSADTAAQILFAGIRFTLAGALTVIAGSLVNRRILIPRRGSGLKILKLSLLQTVGQYVFFYIGLAATTGVKASIIEGVSAFIAILVASLIFRQEKLTSAKTIGCILGFAGVVIVNLGGSRIDFSFSFFGEGFILISTVAYAFSSVFLKRYCSEESPTVLSGYQFLVGGIIMTAAGFFFGGRLGAVSISGVLMLLYLAFISAAAYTLWGILLKYNPVSKVAVFGFMNPVFGVILSALLLDEGSSLGPESLIALALICAGIYIVNRRKAKK